MAETTQQAFTDFPTITGKCKRIRADIKHLANEIERLEELEDKILNDTTRKANLKKVIDIYPKLSVQDVIDNVNELKAFRQYLITEGLAEE